MCRGVSLVTVGEVRVNKLGDSLHECDNHNNLTSGTFDSGSDHNLIIMNSLKEVGINTVNTF